MPFIKAGSRTSVTTTGGFALATESVPCYAVHVGATGIILVGDSSVQTVRVPAGQSLRLAVDNVQNVHVKSASGTLTVGYIAEKS